MKNRYFDIWMFIYLYDKSIMVFKEFVVIKFLFVIFFVGIKINKWKNLIYENYMVIKVVKYFILR